VSAAGRADEEERDALRAGERRRGLDERPRVLERDEVADERDDELVRLEAEGVI